MFQRTAYKFSQYLLKNMASQLHIYSSKNIEKYSYFLPCVVRNYSSKNILALADRGLWNDRFPQSNLNFERCLAAGKVTVYAGFDPTADGLHIGNLLVLVALLHFQRYGHNVIALIGGATSQIGDPSGKSKERPILEIGHIEKNTEVIKFIIENIFKNHEEFIWKSIPRSQLLSPIRIINNIDWYRSINVISFLREVGKHMRMGSLLGRSTIESRLSSNEPLSYTEFSYQVMQAYDWLHLNKNFNCTVQVGGSDQMGNIVTGHQLISRIRDEQVTGLTVPLVTSESGDKLGKSSGSPVWLNSSRTSPFDFYQFLIRTKDSEVENLLKLLTFIPLPEIKGAMEIHISKPEKKIPHKKLAEHLTLLVHGEEGVKKAKQSTELLFGGNSSILAEMKSCTVLELFKNSTIKSFLLQPGTSILDLAMMVECFPSRERAFQVIKDGGFYINQARVVDPLLLLIPGVHILPSGLTLIRVGKRNYYIVNWKS